MPGRGATAAAGFVALLPVEPGDEPWRGACTPAEGPERDGRPTFALRWPVDQLPVIDSPALLSGWDGVAAVRFQLYLDRTYPFRCNVLLTGSPGGYWITSIPLDQVGWRQITIPTEQFAKAHDPDLATTQRLAFRMQGYGQPELPKGMVWYVDDIEALPKPGVKLTLTNSLEANRAAWMALAQQGNPYLLLNAATYRRELAQFQPPAEITSTWQYRGVAEALVPVAFAAADDRSEHKGRRDLVDHAIAGVDWLVGQLDDEGRWFPKPPAAGDPNVNRFTLGPLLDVVTWLRRLPEGDTAWPRWRDKLAVAVDLQRRAYRDQVDWDWGGKAAGEYANQDAYYVLILALSAELFERPDDEEAARGMLRSIADNLLPDGGIHYIGVEMESPIYHALNLVILGRYAALTKDPAAVKLLQDTANYWPLTLTAEGQPESWSDVWWKQNWGYVWPESVVIAAGATGDRRNQYLMWQVLAHTPCRDAGMAGIYAADHWPGTDAGEAPPQRYLVEDRNIRGWRGREGNWSYGVTQGRGQRNTFVGGLVTSPTHMRPLLAAFRGAQIDVLPEQVSWRGYGRWLSQVGDRTGVSVRPDTACALGVRYRLQEGLINGWPTPETPDSPWQVTQLWLAGGDGIVGAVILEAMVDAPAATIAGRLALGPQPVEQVEPGLWGSGPLRVKLLQTFGEVGEGPTPHYTQQPEQQWHGVILTQALNGGAKQGARFVYAAWIGPETATPPDKLELLPDDLGWVATWPDGSGRGVLFNPTETQATALVPWQGGCMLWGGEAKPGATTTPNDKVLAVPLAPSGCAIVAR